MNDTRNIFEKAQSITQIRTGGDLSPQLMASEFAKMGPEARVNYIDDMNRDLRTEHFATPREAAKYQRYRREILKVHQTLRAVDR